MLNEPPVVTVADGLKTNLGSNTWPIVRDLVDGVVVVSEEDIVASMKLVWQRMKLVRRVRVVCIATCVLTSAVAPGHRT